MPINGSGSRGSTRTILQILQIRFVEAQSPTADSGSFRSEQAAGRFAQIAFTVPFATVQYHLIDFSHFGGGGEETGITGYATHAGSSLIMHIATQVLTTQEVVCSRRHYLFFGVFLQRQVHGTLQAHRRIELLSQIEVHRQLDN